MDEELSSEDLARMVSVKDGHIVIDVEFEYNIELSRASSYADIVAWVQHLAEKTWMPAAVLGRFVSVACHEAGLKIPNP